jgi:pimeloyl-ACP methyl ester carboxylesterase
VLRCSPLLSNIEEPTLVIAGGKDDAVPMHHADQLVSGINGARLDVVPEGKHTLIWTNPDDVDAITERFLEA